MSGDGRRQADVAAPPDGTPAGDALTRPTTGRGRVLAIDAVRGLAVAILLLAVHPGPRDALPAQLAHPAWHGVTFADLFFPLFLFAVGAVMPFSTSASSGRAVARRALLLFAIGVGLSSAKNLELVVPGVLQHIAGSFVLAWLLLKLPRRAQLPACAALVVGYWLAFLVVADPGADPWSIEGGTFAHELNALVFGGFRTEGLPQTIISTVNVVAGAFAGRWVREEPDRWAVLRRAGLWALGLIVGGLVLDALGVPLNKKLWSPSFTVFTAGTSLGWFAAALWAIDLRGWRRAAQPLVELGSNAIAVYITLLLAGAVLTRHRGPLDDLVARVVPDPTAVTLGWAVLTLVVGWLCCHLLYRRRIFLKI